MPKFKVENQSKHLPPEAFKKVRSLLETDRELRKLDANFVCDFNDQTLTGSAKGSKFEADLRVTAKSGGSLVEIEVNLPFILTPVKGVVQSTLQKKMEAALA